MLPPEVTSLVIKEIDTAIPHAPDLLSERSYQAQKCNII